MYDIKLPPLPEFDRLSSMHADDVVRRLQEYGRKCARAAIEADRKRGGEPVARLIALYDAAKSKYRAECLAYYEGQADAYDMAIQIVESTGPQPAESCASLMSDKTACGSENGDYDPQPAEPVSVPKHLIERLRKHCENKDNTAFARSTMREALQYLTAESDRGEPVAWLVRDDMLGTWLFRPEKPEQGLWKYVKPLYAAPQAAEPVNVDHGETRSNIGLKAETGSDLGGVVDHGEAEPDSYVHTAPDDCETLHWRGQILSLRELAAISAEQVKQESVGEACAMPGSPLFTMASFLASDVPPGSKLYVAPQPAEPVKVPSDEEIIALAREQGSCFARAPRMLQFDFEQPELMRFARALLARYGQNLGRGKTRTNSGFQAQEAAETGQVYANAEERE